MNLPIAIIGGGPTGLATAIALAQKEIPVVVFEKNTWPQDKVCGEGLMPSGVEFLKKWGVFPYLSKEMMRPFQGIYYRDPLGIIAQGKFKEGPGLGIRRTNLSQALWLKAQEEKRIELREETQFIRFTLLEKSIQVTSQKQNELKEEKFSLLIGADGLRSQVRKQANLEAASPGKQKRWGARQHFAISPWNDHVEIWWERGIEAYITPSGEKQVEVAFLWDREQFRPIKAKGIEGFLPFFPGLAQRLEKAQALSAFRGIGPLAVAADKPTAQRILLIGDAFTYLDGITGEGISIGFAQAQILAEKLPSLWKENKLNNPDLFSLGKQIQEKTRTYLTMTHLALVLTRYPFLRTQVIKALSRSPLFFQHFLEVNMGKRPLWKIPLRAIPQLIWGLVDPRRFS